MPAADLRICEVAEAASGRLCRLCDAHVWWARVVHLAVAQPFCNFCCLFPSRFACFIGYSPAGRFPGQRAG